MTPPERRRTERLLVSIPIRVLRFDEGRGQFLEDSQTVAINQDGARIRLRTRVFPGDTLRIINLENYAEADFQVVGVMRLESGEPVEWGIESLEKERNIWGVTFSRPLAAGEEAGALLECRVCQRQEFWPLTVLDIEILDSVGTVVRECRQCHRTTYWVYAELERRPASLAPDREPPPRQVKVHQPVERRATKRLALKLPLFVRNAKGEEEFSRTENVTKAGFAACVSLELSPGDVVTVICPYTDGGQNIEQQAEVRWVDPYPSSNKRLCGFAYLARRAT